MFVAGHHPKPRGWMWFLKITGWMLSNRMALFCLVLLSVLGLPQSAFAQITYINSTDGTAVYLRVAPQVDDRTVQMPVGEHAIGIQRPTHTQIEIATAGQLQAAISAIDIALSGADGIAVRNDIKSKGIERL